MTRSTLWHIGAVLDIHEMSTHMLVTPRGIACEIGDMIPLVIGAPGKVHGIDLCAASEG
jgi:hypothetical protein